MRGTSAAWETKPCTVPSSAFTERAPDLFLERRFVLDVVGSEFGTGVRFEQGRGKACEVYGSLDLLGAGRRLSGAAARVLIDLRMHLRR